MTPRTLIITLLACCLSHCAYPNANLQPFVSDGCSCFPDGTLADPQKWRAACVRHDWAYWQGGTATDRLKADRALRQALLSKGHPLTAHIAYLGVRAGGHPLLPTPWRWGYGWPYPRGYRSLQKHEHDQIHADDFSNAIRAERD